MTVNLYSGFETMPTIEMICRLKQFQNRENGRAAAAFAAVPGRALGRPKGIPNRWPAALAKEIARLSEAVEKLRDQRRLESEHGERILAPAGGDRANSSGCARGSRDRRRHGAGHWGGEQ